MARSARYGDRSRSFCRRTTAVRGRIWRSVTGVQVQRSCVGYFSKIVVDADWRGSREVDDQDHLSRNEDGEKDNDKKQLIRVAKGK